MSGASSGLGKAISHNLARQGLNIVLCALDDTLLAETHKEFVKKSVHLFRHDWFTVRYPKLEFRKVGCNLGDPKGSYLQIIKDATADISVQVVFSNAGYIIISVCIFSEFFNRASVVPEDQARKIDAKLDL